jgi:hypothetical protein
MRRLLAPLALSLLAGCGQTAREEPPPGALSSFHYAVVSFPNHFALRDRAAADLRKLGLEVIEADRATGDTAAATLWVDLTLDHRPQGDTVQVRVADQAGAERYQRRASGSTESVAVDEALSGLKPLLGAPPPPSPGKVIEL